MNRARIVVVAACLTLGGRGLAAQGPPDRRAAEAAMMKADQDFNQAMADGNLDRFLSFVAEDASFETAPTRGRDAVAKAWAVYFQPGGPKLAWKPTRVDVLVGGEIGYTVGTWERRASGPDGRPVVARGEYLTVWRKQKDGSWQAVFDGGSTE